ncbi:MAG: hypothetical protein GY796_13985 [Chloroflexi bacterium]|nr:hypothetical protein [Chloroflexota bacterium]
MTTTESNSPMSHKIAIESLLKELQVVIPDTNWIALATEESGIFYSNMPSFPSGSGLDPDRVLGVSAALMGLGQRICVQLENGNYQYALISGSKRKTLAITIDDKHVLSFDLDVQVDIGEVFTAVRQTLPPLLHLLEIEKPPISK